MNGALTIYAAAVFAATAVLLLAAARRHAVRRRRDVRRRHYVARIITVLRHDDIFAAERITARTRRHRQALAEALHTIVCHTYGAGTVSTGFSCVARPSHRDIAAHNTSCF